MSQLLFITMEALPMRKKHDFYIKYEQIKSNYLAFIVFFCEISEVFEKMFKQSMILFVEPPTRFFDTF